MSQGAPEGGKEFRGRSNLQLRVLSGVVLAVITLSVTVLGGFAFRLFAVVLAALVLQEWLAMRPVARGHAVFVRAAFAAALAVMLAGLAPSISFAALGVAFLAVIAHATLSGAGNWSAFGIAYAGLPALALTFLRGNDEAGLIAVLFLFAVVWASDIFAYFIGRAVGGPKLAPAISPGKTWSGAAGGVVGAVVAGLVVVLIAGVVMPMSWAAAAALLLSVAAQVGDLYESAVKRRHGVKDSGTVIPGHGGVMDRVDGLIAATLFLYVIGVLYSGNTTSAASFFSQ